MDVDGVVGFVLDRFNALLAAGGARLDVVGADATTLTLRYVAGPDPDCEACALDPDDLDVLVADALARQGATASTVTILR